MTTTHVPTLLGRYDRDTIERVVSEAAVHDLPAIIAALEHDARWEPFKYQLAPDAALGWALWLFLAGRMTGKTDACAHYVDEHVQGPPCIRGYRGGHHVGIIAPTLGDAVDACVRGPSGLITHNPKVVLVNAPGGLVARWPNGVEAKLFGAFNPEDVERLRAGGNRCLAWLEEFAAWRQIDGAFTQMTLGTRLGSRPHAVASTTPKPRGRLKELVNRALGWKPGDRSAKRWHRVMLTRARTWDNPAIDADVRQGLYDEYAGTRLGQQELEGMLIEDFEGALWHRAALTASRVDRPAVLNEDELKAQYGITRGAIGVDPSTWDPEVGTSVPEVGHGIETGIVVVGISADRHVYVFEDLSGRYAPHEWAEIACDASRRWGFTIVPEKNMGGPMVTSTVQLTVVAQEAQAEVAGEPPPPPVLLDRVGVRAAQAKRARAEPVATLWDGTNRDPRGHVVGDLPLLEDQLCQWDPRENWSPDRLDALVWAATWLSPWAAHGAGSTAALRGRIRR